MHRRLVVAIAIAVASVSCSGPPTTERQEADNALAAARAAGAHTYAPAELAAAEATLANYDAAVAERDYRQALRLAIEAAEGARAAGRRAAEQRAALGARAERLIASVEVLVKAANARLAGQGGPRPSPAAAARLRATVKTATSAVQEARSLMTAQDYPAVISTLEPITAGLQKDLESLTPVPSRRGGR